MDAAGRQTPGRLHWHENAAGDGGNVLGAHFVSAASGNGGRFFIIRIAARLVFSLITPHAD
jgi:hypothetical protein